MQVCGARADGLRRRPQLACADTAVFAELCWNRPLEQAEARIHRMGQKASHVNVYYLTAGEGDKSPDSAMFGALVKSRGVGACRRRRRLIAERFGQRVNRNARAQAVDVAEEQARGARMQAFPGSVQLAARTGITRP